MTVPPLAFPGLALAETDERLELFSTPRDWLRYAIGRFRAAGLAFGHGVTTALDEAAFIILEGLNLPIDTLDPFLDARLLRRERERLDALIEARVTTRKPAAYLLNRAYIQGVPFYVDERVIVPRSFIGELLMTAFAEDNGLDRRPCGGFARPRPLRRRRLARHSRRPRFSQCDDRRGGSVGRRARGGAAERRRARAFRSHSAHRGRPFRAAEGRALRSHSDQSALCRRRGARGVPAGIRRRAAHGACRRSGRARHRPADPERGAGPSDAGREARLRDRPRPGSARPRLSRSALRLARHRGERRRSVPFAGERLCAAEAPAAAEA